MTAEKRVSRRRLLRTLVGGAALLATPMGWREEAAAATQSAAPLMRLERIAFVWRTRGPGAGERDILAKALQRHGSTWAYRLPATKIPEDNYIIGGHILLNVALPKPAPLEIGYYGGIVLLQGNVPEPYNRFGRTTVREKRCTLRLPMVEEQWRPENAPQVIGFPAGGITEIRLAG